MEKDWLLKDDGGGRFSLRTFELIIDKPLTQTLLKTPDDLLRMGTAWHEIHHWCMQSCTTFGLFLNILHNVKIGIAMQILLCIQSRVEIRKPVLTQIQHLGDEIFLDLSLKDRLDAYLSARKLIDVFLGLGDCSFSECQSLLRAVVPFFFHVRNLKMYDSKYNLTDADAKTLQNLYREKARKSDFIKAFQHMNKTSFRDNLEEQELEDEENFRKFFESINSRFLTLNEPDGSIHPSINYFERLTWITLLEGWAKYFQYSYVMFIGELSKFTIDIDTKWESWDSKYVRPMRTMMEIFYPYEVKEYDTNDVITFMAIVDLAANPSLDPNWLFPNSLNCNLQDFLPGYRFIHACREAKNIKRIDSKSFEEESLELEYKRFVTELCDRLGWEPPWVQAERWLDYYPMPLEFDGIYPFLAGCKLRIKNPLFFGIPNLCINIKSGELWHNFLEQLPIPLIYSNNPITAMWVSPQHEHISNTRQWYTLASNVILDQIFLNEGPVDWTAIISMRGDYVQSICDNIKKYFALNGINIDQIHYNLEDSKK